VELMVGNGHGKYTLSIGEMLKLWVGSGLFWFALNPYWLKGILMSYLRTFSPKKYAKHDEMMQSNEEEEEEEEEEVAIDEKKP
jgi:hypothetical protein